MFEPISSMIGYASDYAGRIFLAAAAIFVLELALPMSRHSMLSRVRGGIFWIIYIVITAVSLTLFQRLWANTGISPLFHLDLSALSNWSGSPILSVVGGIFASILVIQFGEFFYYWFHRMQHTVPGFWGFHAEHHSLQEMNAFNSNHHFTEEIFRIPFITIPVSLLLSFEQGYVPWLWAFLMGWQGIYEHSCTKIHFGWFRYIIPDNRFHRIHHALDPKYRNRNFGSASALWDFVFGTIYYPKKGEWPEIGLRELNEPLSIMEFLARPFRRS